MTNLIEQEALQPYFKYTPPKPTPAATYLKQATPCPQCDKPKMRRARLCLICKILSARSPIDPEIYIIDNIECRRLPLTQGKYSLVWAADYDHLMLWRWQARYSPLTKSWYAGTYMRMYGRPAIVRVHNIVFNLPLGIARDHENHDTLDNRRNNLRPCSTSQNMAHRRISRMNTSGYIGVHWNCGHEKWSARIGVDGKRISLGYSDDIVEAAKIRDAAAINYFGEFAVLNFPIAVKQEMVL